MAHSQESTSSSGYWSSQTSTSLDPHYLCYWRDSCNGQHELNKCYYWKKDLGGKLGIYFSPSNTYKLFTRDRINNKDLTGNPTGCTTVHLLVFNAEKKEVLFGLKGCKESKRNPQPQSQPTQLVFPSAKPYQQGGDMLLVARRAFLWLTTDTDWADQCLEQGLIKHFLFQDANVIYPVHLTNEQCSKLTRNFVRNEEFQSLHWFPLSEILSQLTPRPNYITKTETDTEPKLNQRIDDVEVKLGNHPLWHVIVRCLKCIRGHVPGGVEGFLNV
jgi:hypothetical protein